MAGKEKKAIHTKPPNTLKLEKKPKMILDGVRCIILTQMLNKNIPSKKPNPDLDPLTQFGNKYNMIPYLCMGESMLPTLPKLCFVKLKPMDSYKMGDIIGLKTHDKLHHVHRITEITDEWVSTKGDNLYQHWYEIKVQLKFIEGKLIWFWPKPKV